VTKAWSALKDHSGFPVLDGGELVGIITSAELVASKKSRISREAAHLKTPATIGKVMRVIGNKERFTVSPDTNPRDAAQKILEAGTNILVVEENKQVAGAISRKDLLRAFL